MTEVYVIKISDGYSSWYHGRKVYRSEEIALEAAQYIRDNFYKHDAYEISVEKWDVV